MTLNQRTGGLVGSDLDRHRHVCMFYRDSNEEYRLLRPFITEGFRRGDKGPYYVPPDQFLTELSQPARPTTGVA